MRFIAIALLLTAQAAAEGDPAQGKELFVTCAGCHSVTSDQKRNAPSLRSLFGKVTLRNGRHTDDENVRAIVLDGYNGMPSFRYSFRPAEIDDLMAYLHTLTAKPTQAETSDGAQYFKAYCSRCHNPDSRASTALDLRGRYRSEWLQLVNEGHAGAPPLKQWLDAPAREALMSYLKTY
jgi:mono/diheme cytochrome c family protein